MSILQGAAYPAAYVAPVVAGSTVVLTVTAPDQTISTPAVATTPQGATASVPGALVGTYLLVWSVTGTETDVRQDQFTVIAPGLDLINLSDLKDELNLEQTDTNYDAQLRRWLKSATFVVENITDPLMPATRTDVFDGANEFFVLPFRWVSALTTVVETLDTVNYVLTEQPLGHSVDNYGYTWDRTINKVVRRGAAGTAIPFAVGISNISCTYVLGMATIPDDIQMATSALIHHWFSKSNQAAPSAFNAPSTQEEGVMVGNYFVPNEVLELLDPWRRRPGIF